MTRLFTSGFETGDTREWNSATAAVTVAAGYKRSGDYGATLPTFQTLGHVFDDDYDDLYFRFAFLRTASTAGVPLVLFDSGGNYLYTFYYNADTQQIDLYSGKSPDQSPAGSLLANGSITMALNVWYVYEIRVYRNASGQIVTKLNNTTDISYNADTSGNGVRKMQCTLASTYYDDFAVNSTDGSYQTSWPNIGGAYMLFPDGDGTTTDWTPDSGTVHYTQVDEAPPNTTDYVQEVDAASVELFTIEDCPDYIATINLVEVLYRAALVEAGENDIQDLVRQGTVNYGGITNTVVTIVDSYTTYKGTTHYVQPNGSGAWGTADVNAIEAGFQIP